MPTYTDRGNFDINATYNERDVVHYNGSLYYCKINNTTGILPTATSNWGTMAKVGVVGYSDRGNYDATATYNKWNVVHYNNSLYYCKVDNTTGILPTTTANWGNMVKCYEPDGETIFVNQDGKLEGAPNALPDNHTILKDSNDVISVNEVYAQDETSLMSAMASLPTGAVGYTPEPNTLDMNQLYENMGVNETEDTALYAHAADSYFLWKGDLVKATLAIAVGGTISSSNTTTANVAEVLTQLNSNVLGTSVDLSPYSTSSNKYTIPRDGYVSINGTNGSGLIAIQSSKGGADKMYIGTTVANSSYYDCLFVKKGFLVWVANLTGTSMDARYIPIK